MDFDWNYQLAEQLDFHWRVQLRPRLDGLSDEEYLWEPVPGCWSIRRRGRAAAPLTHGRGEFVYEIADDPDPAPFTTIAWRLAHVIVGCLGARTAGHFGGPGPADHTAYWEAFAYAGTAKEALDQLDAAYARWIAGVRALGNDGLTRPCGPAEGAYAEYPLAALVLHVHREVLHHGAEIALLRDLYRHRRPAEPGGETM
jgi:hypothetical protein